jgi:Secretion system C-terminal sorting domain
MRIQALAVDQGVIYIGGVARGNLAAISASTGTVLSWNPDADTYGPVWSLATHDHTVYVGGGFYYLGTVPCSGLAAIGAEPPPRPTPPPPGLAQNFPNPAQTVTFVRFALPKAESVTLGVYDLQGRRVVSVLSHEPLPGGAHEVPIRTGGWAPGCYLYRLEAGSAAWTRKMLVVR